MRNSVKRKAAITLAVVVGLVALYTLAGFFLAPWLVKRELARAASNAGLQATVAELRINPYTYSLEATGVTVKEASGAPVASASRLYADFTLASLVQDALRFSTLVVENANVSLVVEPDGRSNLARIAERMRKPSAADTSGPGRAFLVEDLKVRDATLRYADRSRQPPVDLVLGPLDLDATGLTTLASREGRYKLAAALPNNARATAEGTVTLSPVGSSGRMTVSAFNFETVWPFIRDKLRTGPLRGTVSLAAHYRLAPGGAFSVSEGDLRLADVLIALPEVERPLLQVASGRAQGVQYDSATGAALLPSVELAQGLYTAIVDPEGRFNWQQIVVPGKDDEPPGRWSVKADAIRLTEIAVRYEDHTRRTPLLVDIARGNAALKLSVASGAAAIRTVAENVTVALAEVALSQPGAAQPLATVASANLEGGRLDTQERVIGAEKAVLRGGNASFVRAPDGEIALAQAFAPARPAAPPDKPAWRYRIGTASVQDTQIAVGAEDVRYDLGISSLAVNGVDSGAGSGMTFQAEVEAAQGGTLSATGTAAPDFGQASAKVKLAGLSVLPLQPLVSRHLTLAVRSGHVNADATVDYARDRKPLLRVAGGFSIGNLAVDDARTKQRFLAWKALTGQSVALDLAPGRLDVKELLLDEPQTAIIISKDRKVNLAQVMKEAPAVPAKAQAPEQKGAESAEPPFPVRVGRLQLRNGTIDFADYSLVLPFSTRVVRATGSALGISTDPQARTELRFGGRIEPSGYATAEGGLNLLHPTTFMDINVKFQNVAMPPLSPYTATFAGRKIDGGRLWLDLDYKIIDKQLAGENKIVMENIELGERVEAPGAMDLPLELAISLLKDSEGRIRMAIPVSGDVDNPQFSYGTLIREAIASALRRLVTAPFRALASLFGGGTSAEEMSKVRFSPGSARVYPPQRESLEKVAKALQERPQLKVVVHGAYDPERDAERLKRSAVRRSLAAAMGQKIEAGEDAGPIAFSDPETQRAIEKLFVDYAGGREALAQFEAQHDKQHGKPTDRRAYYEAMFARLVELHPLPDTALQQLAGARAQAIAAFLAEAGVDKSRIEIGSLRTVTDGSEPTIDAQLALAVDEKRS